MNAKLIDFAARLAHDEAIIEARAAARMALYHENMAKGGQPVSTEPVSARVLSACYCDYSYHAEGC